MNIKTLTVLSLILIVFCIACKYAPEKTVLQNKKHWIVLYPDEAKSIDGNLEWDFILNRPGKYDLQIICDGELASPLSEVKVEAAGLTLNESPKKNRYWQ